MELTREESTRLDLVRFPLIAGVVLGHAYETIVQFGGIEAVLTPSGFAATFIRDFIGGGLAFIAVPLFFFMSGFLFFYKLEWSGPAYLKKLRSRVFTLLIPYLFWNILYLALYTIAQEVPFTAQYLSGGIPRITQLNIGGILNLIFGVTRSPIGFQFWFIRDLILLVILTPVIHLMLYKKLSFLFLAIFFTLWFFALASFFPRPESIFFFFAGSLLAVNKKTPFWLDRFGLLIISICLLLFTLDALYSTQWFGPVVHKTAIAVGVLAALFASKMLLYKKVAPVFLWLGTASFFVFAFHEPFMGFIERVILKLYLPTNDLTKLFFFFAIPLLVILISLGLYKLLSSLLPRLTSIITGGRTRPVSQNYNQLPSTETTSTSFER